MKRKPKPKSKRPRGRPENEVETKRVSRRVQPEIYDDIITYIELRTKQFKQSKGEL